MRAFEAQATINAPPDRIWAILTDGAAYPSWDSGVERVEGTIAAGETIRVYSEVSPGRAFPVKVGDVVAGQRMTWSSGMPLGLFRGARTFRLDPAEGGVRFTMREEYTGPLAGLITRSIPDLGPSFTKFANGLKARAEAS
jgi:hypothetical protein